MYNIIGADGNEYGPSSADEIRQWVREGRADGRTLVKVEGGNEWKPLATYPEFVGAFALSPGGAPRPFATGPVDIRNLASQVIAANPSLPVGRCLGEGWNLLKANFGLLFTAAIVICGLYEALSFVPLLVLVAPLFKGVFFGGLYLVLLKRLRGQPATIGEAFSGFGEHFVPLLLAGVVGGLLMVAGCCCFILPGIYLFVAWTFAFLLIVDKKFRFWDALELSRRVITAYWFQMAILLLLVFLPYLLMRAYGRIQWMDFYTSWIHAHPMDPSLVWTDFARYLQQVEVMLREFARLHPYLELANSVVLVLIQPFAKAVVAAAYEILLNPRPKTPA